MGNHETSNGPGWSVPWRVYVDQRLHDLRDFIARRFDDNAKLYDERNKANELALATAREAIDRRLDLLNEFREQLRDQSLTFATRIELAALADKIETETSALADKLDTMQSAQDTEAGRRTVTTAIISAATSLVVGVVVGAIVYFLFHKGP